MENLEKIKSEEYIQVPSLPSYYINKRPSLKGPTGRVQKPKLAAKRSKNYSFSVTVEGVRIRRLVKDLLAEAFILKRPLEHTEVVLLNDLDISKLNLEHIEVISTKTIGWYKHPYLDILVNVESGDIISCISKDRLLPFLSEYFYKRITLNNKHYLVHRLVYEAKNNVELDFALDGLTVDHIDNNKSNNHFSNLQLLTPEENTSKYFAEHYSAGYKITESDKAVILKERSLGLSNKEIYEKHFSDKLKNGYGQIRYVK